MRNRIIDILHVLDAADPDWENEIPDRIIMALIFFKVMRMFFD